MQALSTTTAPDFQTPGYNAPMRKSDLSRERPPLAQRFVALRQAAGLTQVQLATMLGVAPSVIAFWELKGTPPRGEVLPGLAKAFGVSVDEILGVEPIKPKRQAAKGKLQALFEAASQLPRRQQEKVIAVLEPFVSAHGSNGH
jgi:transcriptional regulator with XRE-family HTH domain